MSKLTCGGRGPCCHVGYAHRHCEHCDTVVPLSVQPHYHGYPWYQTYSAVSNLLGGNLLGGISSSLANQMQSLQSGFQVTEVPINDAGQ